MSSSEDSNKGKPPEPPEPPDLGLASPSGPFNEPTPQAHSVSQIQGDTSRPTSPASAEHGKVEDDVPATVEAHATMSQESDVSSIDPHALSVEAGTIEENPGKTGDQGSTVIPEAAQTPATTPTSNPQTTAMATMTTTQSAATTLTTSNTPTSIATSASKPEKEAEQAIPVPGLTDPSSGDLVANPGSRVSPEQVVQQAIEAHFVAHSMSGLQLGDDSIPETGPRPENVTLGGPRPSPDASNPAAQHPLSSTLNKPLTEQPNSSYVSATASSEQLSSTIPAAPKSTLSATGFESASDLFLGETSSNVPAVQSTDPGVSGSVGDSEMLQDPARESEAEMDTTHQSAYTQHSEGSPSGVQPGPSKVSSPDADQALQLMGQLFRAHQAGNLADVTSQLQGPQAEQLK